MPNELVVRNVFSFFSERSALKPARARTTAKRRNGPWSVVQHSFANASAKKNVDVEKEDPWRLPTLSIDTDPAAVPIGVGTFTLSVAR
jgi:hypothetical protein